MRRRPVPQTASASDEDLMCLVAAGDAEALGALYDRHAKPVYFLAYRLLGNTQAAEDLTQEAFLKVYRSAATYRAERGSVRTWILRITRNRGIDIIRAYRKREDRYEEYDYRADRDAAFASNEGDVFSEVWLGFEKRMVRSAMVCLTSDQRAVVELSYFSGYTHVEIAGRLGIPVGTVKGRLRSALKSLRKRLSTASTGAVTP